MTSTRQSACNFEGQRAELHLDFFDPFISVLTHLVRLHQVGGLGGQALLLLDVVSHIAELLLQHAHRLKVGRMVEGITAEEQELTTGKTEGLR